jgi:hypothetical protein
MNGVGKLLFEPALGARSTPAVCQAEISAA